MRTARVALALLIPACGSAAPAPEPPTARTLPAIDGLSIYPVPREDAPADVRRVLDQLSRVLAHHPEPPASDSLVDVQEWAETTFSDYLREHRASVAALEEVANALARRGGPDALLGAIAIAVAYEDFYRTIDGVVVPHEIRDDEVLAATYRDALVGAALPLARRAADAYEYCRNRTALLPEAMRGWAARCAERAATLGAIEAPPPPPTASTRTPAAPIPWPSECEGETYREAPEAPPPDAARPAAIAIVTDAQLPDSSAAFRARFLDAVRARVDALTDTPVVATREVLDAERLRAEHRLRPRGPACGQPPPLAWVLAQRNANLVIGQVYLDCLQADLTHGPCSLRVGFRRAGSRDRGALPEDLIAPAMADRADAEQWLASAAQLTTDERPAYGIGVLRAGAPGFELRITGDAEEDPWLRLAALVREQTEALSACLPEGVVSFDASFDVSPVGDPSGVAVRPRTGGSAESAACVERVLEEARWPCTPAARAQRVEITLCLGRRPSAP